MNKEDFLQKFYSLEPKQIASQKSELIETLGKLKKDLNQAEKVELLNKIFLHPKSIFSFDEKGQVTNKEELCDLYTISADIALSLDVSFTVEESLRFLPVLQQNSSQNEVVTEITLILSKSKLINLDYPYLMKYLLRQLLIDTKFNSAQNLSGLEKNYQQIFKLVSDNIFENLVPEKNKMLDIFFWVAEAQLNLLDRYFVENWEKKEFNDFKTYFYQTEFGKSFVDELLMKRDDLEAFRKGVEKLMLEIAKSLDSLDPFYPLKSILSIVNQKIKMSTNYQQDIEKLKEKQLNARVLLKEDFKGYFVKLSPEQKKWVLKILPKSHQVSLGFLKKSA